MKVKIESEVAQSCPTLSDPNELQPTRLLRPWDFPGKSTGVGCHCLETYKKTDLFSSKCAAAEQFSVFWFVYSTVLLVEKKSSNGAIQVIF